MQGPTPRDCTEKGGGRQPHPGTMPCPGLGFHHGFVEFHPIGGLVSLNQTETVLTNFREVGEEASTRLRRRHAANVAMPANRARHSEPARPAEPRRHPPVHLGHYQVSLEIGQTARSPGEMPPLRTRNRKLAEQAGAEGNDQLFTTDAQQLDSLGPESDRAPMGIPHELQRQRHGAVRGNGCEGPAGPVGRNEQALLHPRCQ